MNKAGKKIIEIKVIPEKKNKENKIFLIISMKSYTNSWRRCLFNITLTLDFSISNSAGFGLKL